MKNRYLKYLILGIIFPIYLNYFLYFGFSTDYTKDVFSQETFYKQYSTLVYKYRVLSQYVLDFTYEVIKENDLKGRDKYGLSHLDEKGNQEFFYAYFVVNTFWLVLLSVFLLKVLHEIFLDTAKAILLFMLVQFVIFVSGFVITHYDMLSYFILTIGYYYAIKYKAGKESKYLVYISIAILIGTLNRETTSLIIAFMAGLISLDSKKIKSYYVLITPFIAFLVPYVGLRIALGTNPIDTSLAQYNITYFEREAGTILYLALAYIISLVSFSNKAFYRFMIFSVPYIVFIFLVGNLHEFRLFIPLLMGQIMLGNREDDLNID